MLHYQTRRWLCRLGFVVLCAAPAAGVLAWAGWLQIPAHVRSLSAELSRDLHAPLTVQAVAYPQPGRAQYEGVVLADPETLQPMLRAARVETGGSNTSQVWIATQLDIETRSLSRLLELIETKLKERAATSPDIRISAAELLLRWPDRVEALTDLVASFGTLEGDRCGDLQFRVRGLDMPEPAKARLFRRPGEPAISGFQLETGESPLPTWVGILVAPWLDTLGERATFRGQIWAERTAAGWQGTLQGVFSGVQLNRLMAGRFPHRLDGLAEVRIEQVRFSAGRLEIAQGTLTAGPGFIGQSLVAESVRSLELTFGDPARANQAMLAYDQLAFAFSIEARGLQLRGLCTEGPERAIAVDRGRLLLGNPPHPWQPHANLIRALLPQTTSLVPASQQSAWLLQWLPVVK